MRAQLPQLLWYENSFLEIDLPDDWQVEICPMQGAGRRPLTLSEMDQFLCQPVAGPGIREMAKGRKTAVIVFDDMTRPTRTFELAPLVIRELEAGGILPSDITFVCALGPMGP